MKTSATPYANHRDIISTLPDGVLAHVISFLSIRDLIATSAISKRWSNLWTLSPSLDFHCLSPSHCDDAAAIITDVIRRHSCKFVTYCHLSLHPNSHDDHLRLLNHLARKSVQTLTLTGCDRRDTYMLEVPPHVFTLSSLEELTLENLLLPKHPNLSQLVNLRRLSLINMINWGWSRLEMNAFLEGVCSKVERLRMRGRVRKYMVIEIKAWEGFKELEIGFVGKNVTCVDVDAPGLESLTVDLNKNCGLRVSAPLLRAFNAKFGRLSCIRCFQLLEVSCGLYLHQATYTDSDIHRELELKASSFARLNKLSISLNLNDIRQVVVLAFMLNECRFLRDLDITAGNDVISKSNNRLLPYMESDFWRLKKMGATSCIYRQLHHIKLQKLWGGKLEMEFVRFLISVARVLKTLVISHDCAMKGLMDDLLLLPFASPDLVVKLFSLNPTLELHELQNGDNRTLPGEQSWWYDRYPPIKHIGTFRP